MIASYVYKGDRIDYKNTGAAAIAYGDVVVAGDLVGVALNNIAVNDTGVILTEGVFEIAAKATDTFAVGAKVYYDTTNKQVTSTTTDMTLIGYATEAKAVSAATAVVRLG
jgi:predicted RecA/RadA family phage recombinase